MNLPTRFLFIHFFLLSAWNWWPNMIWTLTLPMQHLNNSVFFYSKCLKKISTKHRLAPYQKIFKEPFVKYLLSNEQKLVTKNIAWKNSINATIVSIRIFLTSHALRSLNCIKKIQPRMMCATFNGNPCTNQLISQVGRVFANRPGYLGLIPGRVMLKTQKMILDTSSLNTQQY